MYHSDFRLELSWYRNHYKGYIAYVVCDWTVRQECWLCIRITGHNKSGTLLLTLNIITGVHQNHILGTMTTHYDIGWVS
jgi:hypothetical protein